MGKAKDEECKRKDGGGRWEKRRQKSVDRRSEVFGGTISPHWAIA
jgi:hypothetical protein